MLIASYNADRHSYLPLMCDSLLDQLLFGEEALNGGGGSLIFYPILPDTAADETLVSLGDM